jgi:hypothetical protein
MTCVEPLESRFAAAGSGELGSELALEVIGAEAALLLLQPESERVRTKDALAMASVG